MRLDLVLKDNQIVGVRHNSGAMQPVTEVVVSDWSEPDHEPVYEGKHTLHLGCGATRLPDAVNVDYVKTDASDVVFDLSLTPWPEWFAPSNYYDHVEAFDIIEHFVHVVPVINEIYRVLKPGGTVHIHTGRWNTPNSFTDPSHHHYFTTSSFDYWDSSTFFGSNYGWYRANSGEMKVERAEEHGQELDFLLRKV